MTVAIIPLGQTAPSAATLTTLYTVAAATEVITSTLTVCNRSAVTTSFRVALRALGASIADEHYLYYDIEIPGNETFAATVGWTLQATDVISVYATLATLSFNLSGQEITA
jgi:hypothetical protein